MTAAPDDHHGPPRLLTDHTFTHPQNDPTGATYPTIPETIRRTWAREGVRGFYRGLGTNIVRVLPGTCVTFVVYENLAWVLRRAAVAREERIGG
ncbi:hypothetical protein K525DRAFT_275604 [Schizophyllum commune Loenen D]|nr:hypothetical protein K525DRAFT_275604 [Schizophyllum commune Loenen D]